MTVRESRPVDLDARGAGGRGLGHGAAVRGPAFRKSGSSGLMGLDGPSRPFRNALTTRRNPATAIWIGPCTRSGKDLRPMIPWKPERSFTRSKMISRKSFFLAAAAAALMLGQN